MTCDVFQLICTGTYYNEWTKEEEKLKLYSIVLLVAFLLYLGLSIAVLIAKYKWKIDDRKLYSNPQNTTNFGGIVYSLLILFPALFGIALIKLIQTTPPPLLKKYPYKLAIPLLQGILPTFTNLVMSVLLFSRSKKLRQIVRAKFQTNFQEINIHP